MRCFSGFFSLLKSALVSTLLVVGAPLHAQTDVDNIPDPQVTTTFPIEHGYINLSTGSVHLSIPLEAYTQRGDVTAAATLEYDSNFWADVNPCGIECYIWEPVYFADPYDTEGGWHLSYFQTSGTDNIDRIPPGPNAISVACQPMPNAQPGQGPEYIGIGGGIGYIDAEGVSHDFIGQTVSVPDGCVPSDGNTYTTTTATLTAYASDGSGLFASWGVNQPESIWDKNGTLVYSTALQYYNGDPSVDESFLPVDRNGNHLSRSSGLQDTLGRSLLTETDQALNGDLRGIRNYDVFAPGGKTARYSVTYKSITVSTDFHQKDPSGNISQEYIQNMGVVDHITLPDGTTYQFTYDEGGYGEMKSMTLPHGGVVSFDYMTDPGGMDPSRPVLYPAHRWVHSHTGADGSTTFAWHFNTNSQFSEFGAACPSVTNSVQSSTTLSAYVFSECNGALLPKTVTYTALASNTLDATQLFDYDLSHQCPLLGYSQSVRACDGAMWRNLVAKTTVLAATSSTPALTTDTQYGYSNPGVGAPSSMKQWDYYPANPGALPDSPPGNPTRETDQTLSYSVNGALFPTSVIHKDVTGSTIASTSYTYDEPAYYTPRSSSSAALPNQNDSFVIGNRGNLTTVSRCCAVIQGQQVPVVTHSTYDDAGTVLSVVDPNQHQTTFGYDATDTFPQTTTLPATGSVAHVSQTGYDASTGVLTGQLDQNSQGIGLFYDSVGRIMTEAFTNGGSPAQVVGVTYPSANETDYTTFQNAGNAGSSKTIVDGFGRVTQSIQGDSSVDTLYDAQGRVYSVSNAHTANPSSTDGTTVYSYDELGRVKSVTSPLGKATSHNYAGNTETVTDPLGHSRIFAQDIFGDLTSTTEPSLSGSMVWKSVYTYDGLGRLLNISQQGGSSDSSLWRSRTFAYDGVGNLQWQQSPEQGITTYCYDPAGNLLGYLAAASSTQNPCGSVSPSTYSVAYQYDNDNRLTLKAVANEAIYNYSYDAQDVSGDPYGIGRLTAITSNGVTAGDLFTHDAAGRVNSVAFCLPSDCSGKYKTSASYDFQDNLLSLSYPDGRQITWGYDSQNRVINSTYASFNADQIGLTLLSNTGYAPTGELTQANYGSGVISYAAVYDANENITGLAYSNGNYAVTQKAYTWDVNGANLRAIQDSATGRTQSFSYDPLDRIASATDTGTTANACLAGLPAIPSSSETYSPDAWGNLQQSGSFSFVQGFDNNNRINATGYMYDPAGSGNLIQDGLGNNYQYAADGLLAGSNGSSYTFDGLGQRVRKDGGSALEYFYFGGQLVATRDPSSGAWTDRLYGPSGVYATVAGTETALGKFRLTDHLGSLSGTYDTNGGAYSVASSLPYGQSTINQTNDVFPFTDHERDAENGSDSTLFRHLSPAQGRWLAPDPYNSSLDLTDPQSFNRYAYLSNRPMAAVDQYGLCDDGDDSDCDPDDGSDGSSDPGSGSDLGSSDSIATGSSAPAFDSSSGAAFAEAYLSYGNLNLSAQASSDSVAGYFSTVLNIVGLIPELGAAANGINAAIQLSQGNTRQAGFYAAGATLSLLGLPGGSAIAKLEEGVALAENAAQVTETVSLLQSIEQASLADRVATLHGALDPIAATRRTTAAIETIDGTRIFAAGGRDLSPAQRALLGPGEIAGKLTGAHAEVTALEAATSRGLQPSSLAASRTICPACAARITQSGGRITSATTAKW